jgi:hypothetical protein
MRIQIQNFTFMRIQIRGVEIIRIQIGPWSGLNF